MKTNIMRDCIIIIRGIVLYPFYVVRNYLRDEAIRKINNERVERGEEPNDID